MRQTSSDKETKRLKVGWRNIYCTKINQYKTKVAKLPSEIKRHMARNTTCGRDTFYNKRINPKGRYNNPKPVCTK